MRGDHGFNVSAHNGGTRLTQDEKFTGLLVPIMGIPIKRSLANFALMNQALKDRAEAKTAAEAER